MIALKTQQLGLLNLVRFIFILVLLFQHANRHLSRADNIWWGNMALPLVEGIFLLSGLIFQYQYDDKYKKLSSSSTMNAKDKYLWQVKYVVYLIPTFILTICCATAGKWYIQYKHTINDTNAWITTISFDSSTLNLNFSTNGLLWPFITLVLSHIVFSAAIDCIEKFVTASKLYIQQHFQNNEQQQKNCIMTILCGILTIVGFLSRYLWFDKVNTDPQLLMFETWNEIKAFRIFNGICAFFSGVFVGELRQVVLNSVEYYIKIHHMGNSSTTDNNNNNNNNNNEINEQQQNIRNQQNIVRFVRSLLFICITFVISAAYVYAHYGFNYHKDKYIIPSSISIWCFILPMLLCISQIDLNIKLPPFADNSIDDITAVNTTPLILQYFISMCFMLGNIAPIIYSLHYLALVYLGALLGPVSRFNSISAFKSLAIGLPGILVYGCVAFYYLEVPCRRFLLHYLTPYVRSFYVIGYHNNTSPQHHSILQDITDHCCIFIRPNDREDKKTEAQLNFNTSPSAPVNDIL